MERVRQGYERLIANFTAWAEGEEGVRAAAVIGSFARVDHPADAWSDLDIVVIARDPDRYRDSTAWVSRVGEPWLTFVEATAAGGAWERRVLFDGGLDVDFALLAVDAVRTMVADGLPADVSEALKRGLRTLFDKDGLVAELQAAVAPSRVTSLPTQDAFLDVVHDFWYHALWTAKHLRRGELWWAKSGCDGALKDRLLSVIRWHARTVGGGEVDAWFRSRFLEEWADPRVVEGLRSAFAHYEAEDVWRALFATMALFRWVAREAAEGLGFPYPTLGDERVTALVERLHAERV